MNKTLEQSDIVRFFHCAECLNGIPDGIAPRDWASLSVGMTEDGQIQVWCNRHEIEVCTIGISFQLSGRGRPVDHE